MASLVRDRGRLPLKVLVLALGTWVLFGSSAMAYGGGHGYDGTGCWGEYGLGPHFAYHGCGFGEFGYPYFTHGMGYGSPYYGYASGDITGYPYYGSYTGAPPYPDTTPAPTITPSPAPAAGPGN